MHTSTNDSDLTDSGDAILMTQGLTEEFTGVAVVGKSITLAPVKIHEIGNVVAMQKCARLATVPADQNFKFASSVADRHVVEHGQGIGKIPGPNENNMQRSCEEIWRFEGS
jgi:hypothetical protein